MSSNRLTPVKLALQVEDQEAVAHTESAAATEKRLAAASLADRKSADATATSSSTARSTTSSASQPIAEAASSSSSVKKLPRYHVQSIDDTYQVYGVDAIWINQYRGDDSDFEGIRKKYDCNINQLLLQVAKHVETGLYFIISLNASPHSLTVVCGCEKMWKDLPDDMFNDPAHATENK